MILLIVVVVVLGYISYKPSIERTSGNEYLLFYNNLKNHSKREYFNITRFFNSL